jgi:hypothetical protein
MSSSGIIRSGCLVETDVSEERVAFVKVERISGLKNVSVVPSSLILFTLTMEAIRYKSNKASHPRKLHSSETLCLIHDDG